MVEKKPKKRPPYNANTHIRSAVRRAFSRSPIVIETMKKVRRESIWYKQDGSPAARPRVEYQCSQCNEWWMGKDIQVDHKEPVVSPSEGFKDWNTFIARLFCEADNLAVLCKKCHTIKTNQEKEIAKHRRQALKVPVEKVKRSRQVKQQQKE